jgi:CBS domain-containing protein/uncharacterized protein (DUF2267 family)
MHNSIDIFIDRKVVLLKEKDKVFQAAKAMCHSQVGCVVVANIEGQVSGIVTDRDIVCNLVSTELEGSTQLRQIMETDVVSLNEESTVEDAVGLMKEFGIRRLPIMTGTKGKHQRCVGVVTLDDLIAGEFITTKDIGEIVRSQIVRKKQITKHSRTDSRIDQTYHKFIGEVAKQIDLDKEKTEEVVKFITEAIVKRLHYTGGVHFISQLPKRLQEHLLEMPAGPDRMITDNTLIQGLSIRTGKNLLEAEEMAYEFWQVLCRLIGVGETDHVIHQLPKEMQDVLVVPKDSEPRDYKKSAQGSTAVRI